jgi:phytanoyl-CoA hydroxylase
MTDFTSSESTMIERWQHNGYLIKEGQFSDIEIKEIKSLVIANLNTQENPKGVHVWWPGKIPGKIQESICSPRFIEPLKTIFSGDIEFLSVKAVFKTGKVSYGSPWHQDASYWGGSTKVSAWVALDNVTHENGCLRVVPGSHLHPREHNNHQKEGTFDFQLDPSQIDMSAVVDVHMAAGDVLFFHDLLIHSSYPNQNGADRWSLIPTFRSADEPDSSKVWIDSLRLS